MGSAHHHNLDFKELSGFSITHIHRDKPPKVRFGTGFRFFTNAKFGDLALAAKLATQGETLNDITTKSGVSIWRAKRFLNALNIPIVGEPKNPKEKICDVCGELMLVTTRRQKRHDGDCKKKWAQNYYKGRPRCQTKQS